MNRAVAGVAAVAALGAAIGLLAFEHFHSGDDVSSLSGAVEALNSAAAKSAGIDLDGDGVRGMDEGFASELLTLLQAELTLKTAIAFTTTVFIVFGNVAFMWMSDPGQPASSLGTAALGAGSAGAVLYLRTTGNFSDAPAIAGLIEVAIVSLSAVAGLGFSQLLIPAGRRRVRPLALPRLCLALVSGSSLDHAILWTKLVSPDQLAMEASALAAGALLMGTGSRWRGDVQPTVFASATVWIPALALCIDGLDYIAAAWALRTLKEAAGRAKAAAEEAGEPVHGVSTLGRACQIARGTSPLQAPTTRVAGVADAKRLPTDEQLRLSPLGGWYHEARVSTGHLLAPLILVVVLGMVAAATASFLAAPATGNALASSRAVLVGSGYLGWACSGVLTLFWLVQLSHEMLVGNQSASFLVGIAALCSQAGMLLLVTGMRNLAVGLLAGTLAGLSGAIYTAIATGLRSADGSPIAPSEYLIAAALPGFTFVWASGRLDSLVGGQSLRSLVDISVWAQTMPLDRGVAVAVATAVLVLWSGIHQRRASREAGRAARELVRAAKVASECTVTLALLFLLPRRGLVLLGAASADGLLGGVSAFGLAVTCATTIVSLANWLSHLLLDGVGSEMGVDGPDQQAANFVLALIGAFAGWRRARLEGGSPPVAAIAKVVARGQDAGRVPSRLGLRLAVLVSSLHRILPMVLTCLVYAALDREGTAQVEAGSTSQHAAEAVPMLRPLLLIALTGSWLSQWNGGAGAARLGLPGASKQARPVPFARRVRACITDEAFYQAIKQPLPERPLGRPALEGRRRPGEASLTDRPGQFHPTGAWHGQSLQPGAVAAEALAAEAADLADIYALRLEQGLADSPVLVATARVCSLTTLLWAVAAADVLPLRWLVPVAVAASVALLTVALFTDLALPEEAKRTRNDAQPQPPALDNAQVGLDESDDRQIQSLWRLATFDTGLSLRAALSGRLAALLTMLSTAAMVYTVALLSSTTGQTPPRLQAAAVVTIDAIGFLLAAPAGPVNSAILTFSVSLAAAALVLLPTLLTSARLRTALTSVGGATCLALYCWPVFASTFWTADEPFSWGPELSVLRLVLALAAVPLVYGEAPFAGDRRSSISAQCWAVLACCALHTAARLNTTGAVAAAALSPPREAWFDSLLEAPADGSWAPQWLTLFRAEVAVLIATSIATPLQLMALVTSVYPRQPTRLTATKRLARQVELERAAEEEGADKAQPQGEAKPAAGLRRRRTRARDQTAKLTPPSKQAPGEGLDGSHAAAVIPAFGLGPVELAVLAVAWLAFAVDPLSHPLQLAGTDLLLEADPVLEELQSSSFVTVVASLNSLRAAVLAMAMVPRGGSGPVVQAAFVSLTLAAQLLLNRPIAALAATTPALLPGLTGLLGIGLGATPNPKRVAARWLLPAALFATAALASWDEASSALFSALGLGKPFSAVGGVALTAAFAATAATVAVPRASGNGNLGGMLSTTALVCTLAAHLLLSGGVVVDSAGGIAVEASAEQLAWLGAILAAGSYIAMWAVAGRYRVRYSPAESQLPLRLYLAGMLALSVAALAPHLPAQLFLGTSLTAPLGDGFVAFRLALGFATGLWVLGVPTASDVVRSFRRPSDGKQEEAHRARTAAIALQLAGDKALLHSMGHVLIFTVVAEALVSRLGWFAVPPALLAMLLNPIWLADHAAMRKLYLKAPTSRVHLVVALGASWPILAEGALLSSLVAGSAPWAAALIRAAATVASVVAFLILSDPAGKVGSNGFVRRLQVALWAAGLLISLDPALHQNGHPLAAAAVVAATGAFSRLVAPAGQPLIAPIWQWAMEATTTLTLLLTPLLLASAQRQWGSIAGVQLAYDGQSPSHLLQAGAVACGIGILPRLPFSTLGEGLGVALLVSDAMIQPATPGAPRLWDDSLLWLAFLCLAPILSASLGRMLSAKPAARRAGQRGPRWLDTLGAILALLVRWAYVLLLLMVGATYKSQRLLLIGAFHMCWASMSFVQALIRAVRARVSARAALGLAIAAAIVVLFAVSAVEDPLAWLEADPSKFVGELAGGLQASIDALLGEAGATA